MACKVALTCGNWKKIGPYREGLERAGLEPAIVTAEGPYSLEGCGGLMLSGGADVNPRLYGESPHPLTEDPHDDRDAMEIALVRDALAADLPVLAICRGIQLLNVALGGTLLQHIENHKVKQNEPVHEAVVYAGTRLAAILGAGRVPVNSRHHQAVGKLAPGLVVTARAAGDGVVEAVEHEDKRFVVAVQWHPEDQAPADPRQEKLFQAFARAAEATAGACDSVR